MCKAIDRSMRITNVELLHKEGGKSGIYNRSVDSDEAVVIDVNISEKKRHCKKLL